MRCVLSIFASLLAATAAVAQEAPPRADWIAADVAVASRVRTARALESPDPAALRAALGIPEHREDRDQGFGARVLRDALHGGYTTHWVTIVTFRGAQNAAPRVASVRIDARSSLCESWEHAGPAIREAWGAEAAALVELDGGARVEWRDAAVLADMRRVREAVLGAAPEPRDEPPPELAAALQLLLDPREELDVGEVCYYDGAPPRGSAAALALAAAGRLDLLRIVLRGANPEGRVYAARELLKRRAAGERLSNADLAALRAVRALEVPISTCAGCLVTDLRAAEVLPAVD